MERENQNSHEIDDWFENDKEEDDLSAGEEDVDEEDDLSAGEEDAEEEEREFNFGITQKPHKSPFKLKHNENGKILTVHHTVREQDKFIRIRLGVCCFSEQGAQLAAIDKRGNVFVFDLVIKRYWRLQQTIIKASVIRASVQHANQYLVGSKLGHLLLLDVDKSRIPKTLIVSSEPIMCISFPAQKQQPSPLALLHAGHEAILINLETFTATHRLEFDQIRISLKFTCYLPQSDQIFTCFTNDTIHLWSGVTLNTLRIAHPIKARDRKLRVMENTSSIPEFSLESPSETNLNEFQLHCQDKDYSNGLIVAYCLSNDGSQLCLSTLDNYLLLISSYTMDIQNIFRLRDFMIRQCVFLPKPKQQLIFGLTSDGQVVLLDCQNTEFKMIVQPDNACSISIASDGKLLAVLTETGEVDVWSTCRLYNTLKSQEQCIQMLKEASKQTKPVALRSVGGANKQFNENITAKLLKQDRLLSILKEFGCYPAKYRSLIWCALLKLPCNHKQFQLLLKMGTPAAVKQRADKLKLKNDSLKRGLVKIWSCLAHWCTVFAYSDFLPNLIFPFVKLFPKNTLVTFEICATLLSNHFQLWFEFHPMEPANYLGMCENLLQHFDPELGKFYAKKNVLPVHYAWSLLSNAFAESLDEEHWLCLWDNLMTCPPYFPIFCTVAFNILQREVILRLPNKDTVTHYFHEQNAVDVRKIIARANRLMEKCPPALNPKRYMKPFEAIPKNVYPKFLNYPKEWVTQHEENVVALQKEHRAIDDRIHQLEMEEFKMMERLENGQKAEEHAKRIKEMEKLYQDTIKREEERLAFQRKMLLLYQKEIRNRKGEVIATLQESEYRKKTFEMENEIDGLMRGIERERIRNDTNMILAEDEIRNHDLELVAQKHYANTYTAPLGQKYRDAIQRLSQERTLLSNTLGEVTQTSRYTDSTARKPSNLDDIEKQIDEIQREFMCLTALNK